MIWRLNILFSGVFFTMFEGFFWKYGIKFFEDIKYFQTLSISGVVYLLISILFFSLFIHYTAREVGEVVKIMSSKHNKDYEELNMNDKQLKKIIEQQQFLYKIYVKQIRR